MPDMPAKDFLKAIDDITPHVDPHKTFITFTGGEALVRNDIEEVGLELYRRGFPWGIVTNGFLLDERRLDSLLEAGMHSITVSFDGFEEDHNWIRQNDKSFERADRAVKLLVQTPDIVWDIVTCVNPRNYGRLEEFKEYLISIGVRRWRLFSIFPMGRAAENPELQLSDGQFRGLFDFIKRVREAARAFWAPTRARCATITSTAVPVSMWRRCWWMAQFRAARRYGRTSIRAISTRTTCGMFGRTVLRSTATAAGLRKASVPTAICGNTVRAAGCTYTMTTSSCCSVTTIG